MAVDLYIGGRRVDCAPDGLILMNWTREELDSPATIRNTYSQSITIPATPENNAVFGRIWMSGRVTPSGGYNPLKRADFAIYDDLGAVLQSGYAKLNAIQRRGRDIYAYAVTLYGGLGDFFANLATDADGHALTLAGIRYRHNGTYKSAADIPQSCSAVGVATNWDELRTSAGNLLTFVPAYNGIPSGEFDADKALVRAQDFANVRDSGSEGGVSYWPLNWPSDDTALCDLGGRFTEWETQDLRGYLQRPALWIPAFFDAISQPQNNGGYSVTLDPSFFNASNPRYNREYLTLPLLDIAALVEDGRTSSQTTLADFLRDSMSPADLLISYCKTYGLLMVKDEARKHIDIMQRSTYYATGADVIDLTERVDLSRDRSDIPSVTESPFYDFRSEMAGQAASEYEAQTGARLGSQRIATGWEFGGDAVDIMASVRTRGAAVVTESSPYFFYGFTEVEGDAVYQLKFGKYGTPSVTYYDRADHSKTLQVSLAPFSAGTIRRYGGAATIDLFPKIQLHGADNAPEDGAGILVQFLGMVALPEDSLDGSAMEFRLTDDSEIMGTLNGGRACWDMRRIGPSLTELPQFTWADWTQIYPSRWQAYLADRLDADTRVMRCWVDFRGIPVDGSLLRRFFFYDGVLWSLNRIVNHSITTTDPTECEFVRVQDIANYTTRQI